MHSEDLLINNRGDRQTIETVRECLPQLDIVASLAFIIEAVYTVDRGAFVITTENKEVLGVLDLICKEQANCFQRLLSTINIIAKEEVVRFRRESSIFE